MRWHNFTIRKLLLAVVAVAILLAFLVVPWFRSYRWQNNHVANIALDREYRVNIFLAPDTLSPTLAQQEHDPARRSRSLHFSVDRNGESIVPLQDIEYDVAPYSDSPNPYSEVKAFYSADRAKVCIVSGDQLLLLGDLKAGQFKSKLVIQSEDAQTFAPIGSIPDQRYTGVGPIRKEWHAIYAEIKSVNPAMGSDWELPRFLQHY